MFITVKFGADQQIILNSNCKVVNLVESLREKCHCGPEVPIDLMDDSGNLINLSDLDGSPENATNHLRERHCYILVKINRGDGSEPVQYESMLENLSKSYPELAERLQKLSHPHTRDKWRNNVQKKTRAPVATKSRTVSQQKNRPL
ncbi:hypothetical protein GDO86_001903 [Hymenochirus boettgeri]|uniref:Uncharacterized protein n=1 Tax=Hymenochirus boettgeri TaxID=247094 RepID=A0A8T2KHE4_9PIPI|nr:hypothetical protein GDO86_001903 [Hymenochirus boettgeri]